MLPFLHITQWVCSCTPRRPHQSIISHCKRCTRPRLDGSLMVILLVTLILDGFGDRVRPRMKRSMSWSADCRVFHTACVRRWFDASKFVGVSLTFVVDHKHLNSWPSVRNIVPLHQCQQATLQPAILIYFLKCASSTGCWSLQAFYDWSDICCTESRFWDCSGNKQKHLKIASKHQATTGTAQHVESNSWRARTIAQPRLCSRLGREWWSAKSSKFLQCL